MTGHLSLVLQGIEMIFLLSDDYRENTIKENMKNVQFNTRIRLCFESVPDELGDDLCWVTGALIIIQKPNSEWAYAHHLKSQGGGTFGEYHIICKAEYDQENEYATWNLSVGDYRFFDPSTAVSFTDFNEEEAIDMFAELDKLWDNMLKMGYDYEVDYPYDELYLCRKSDFNTELVEKKHSNFSTFWYSNDEADWNEEIYLGHLDIEHVSGGVPGNMSFIS